MNTPWKYVGLDVHKESIAVAVFGPQGQEPESEFEIPNNPSRIKKLFSNWPADQLRVCYEAGPCGFVLYRQLREMDIDVRVVAPGKIHRAPADRIKTDKRDARLLGSMLRGDMLTAIHVPTEQDESIRDYLRARTDLRGELNRNRQRLLHFLLRKGYKFPGKAWTQKFNQWLNAIEWQDDLLKATADCYRFKIQTLQSDLHEMDQKIKELSLTGKHASTVARLRCLRGIDTLTAMNLAAEIGDFRRFASAGSFMSFLGLVPGEHSSGNSRRQTGITKTGNSQLRRLMIEAAWHARFAGPASLRLRERRQNQPPELVAYAERAQKRLNKKYVKMLNRKKAPQIAATAVAREMAGFIWGITTSEAA